MTTIEKVMSETEAQKKLIAEAWIGGNYTQQQAKLSCEVQGLDFKSVQEYYGRLYHEQECASAGVEV